ncbi:tumor necrosis factor ligand superfamily member 14 [Eublepharis macularius]|uniref:Tumor necrosis factor ligand superfamily member 14 n=1 Tax=Eublepharis macularius TaxID=481883 RepID=A0AA97KPK7_EUBMA|nr:tumor necrosis factor ligand superfamily member 14 [Eublepharis macularius]
MEASARYPSVFVVEGPPRDVPFVPPVPRSQKTRQYGQLFLGMLVLLALAGLAIQAYFLIRFRKELDQATAQRGAEASHDRLIQDHKPHSEKPGAHLTGASFTATGNDTLQWEYRHGVSFLQEMDYKEGSLICRKPGHYYIYSKVTLEHASCSAVQQKSTFVTHRVYKRTPRYPKEIPLLTSMIPYCSTDVWRKNSFLAGTVQLEEKEEVYVKVSEIQLVRVKDGTWTYFGTFMI